MKGAVEKERRRATFDRVMATIQSEDPTLGALVTDALKGIAEELGESPEAWRGAEAVADFLVHVLGHTMDAETLEEQQRRAVPMLMMIMSTATALGLHPMTPWGQGVS